MEFLTYEVRNRIARITMNRPDKLNAINPEMRASLFEAFEDVERNPDVWVAIITGTGRAFSVGCTETATPSRTPIRPQHSLGASRLACSTICSRSEAGSFTPTRT